MRNEKGITGRQPSGNRSFLHRYRRRGQNGVGQGVYGAEQHFEGAELQLYLRRGGKVPEFIELEISKHMFYHGSCLLNSQL